MDVTQNLLTGLIGLILINLVLTAAKAGCLNARYEKLLLEVDREPRAARLALSLLKDREKLVFYIYASHVLLRVLIAGVLAAYLFQRMPDAGLWWVLLALAGLAVLVALVEQGIERQVLFAPEQWTIRLAGFTRLWTAVSGLLLYLPYQAFRLITSGAGRLYRVTEEELNIILDAGQREGVIEVDEREMINSIFQFRDTLAREVMIPRIDLLSLQADTGLVEAIDAMLESGFSRVPVYEDTVDNVLGVLYIKDLLRLFREGRVEETVRHHLRWPYFVPETKKVGELLAEMQNERMHIAIVVDEYGGVAGIVTLEDIVEEIVGEIQDEYDSAEEQVFQKIDENEYVFLGKVDLNDFNEIMGTGLSKNEADTLGGMLYSRFGGVPKVGEMVETDDILMTVEQVTGRRIRKVRVRRQDGRPPAQASEPNAQP